MIKKELGKRNKYGKWIIPAILIVVAVLLNMAGWMSNPLCNWYAEHIFPRWVATYGRVTGMIPFSIGELLLYLAVGMVVVLCIWLPVHFLFCRKRWQWENKLFQGYICILFWIIGMVSIVMTLNCFLLYHVSPMQERYEVFAGKEKEDYGLAEIDILRNYIVNQANELADGMKRDEAGNLCYDGDMKAEAKKQMQRLGEVFPNLKGYYPDPKPLVASDFFSQQYIMGYYFPFSMEANYNDIMCIGNLPATMCHELSHLKGFILEDEANFIGYLACVTSEDDFFRYSGYLSVITYLDRDFYKAIGEDDAYYLSQPVISGQVYEDKKFLSEETWEEVEEDAVLDTEFVKEASNTFTETTLTLNGVKDGKISYSRVVNLLLAYYDGILY